MICVDLGEPGMPITTLGVRPYDAHVTAMGHCYLLMASVSDDPGGLSRFRQIQSELDPIPDGSLVASGQFTLSRFGKGRERVPWYIRSGPMSQGIFTDRKRYYYLEVHGRGAVDVRVYVDGSPVARAHLVATETPGRVRRINLPRSTRGYSLDLEMAGEDDLFAIELGYDPPKGGA